MKRSVIITSDGSSSLLIEDWKETYHSVFGAIQEARHVYIQEGFSQIDAAAFRVLEMGFGTGLNALLTALEAESQGKQLCYHAVEGFPLNREEIDALNYAEQLENPLAARDFNAMHQIEWEVAHPINSCLVLKKVHALFETVVLEPQSYDLIYFDAFGFPYQPELWSQAIFEKMFDALAPNGILVTYACRGPIKLAMRNAGFKVVRLAGPPGKRQMIRAHKISKETGFNS
ncbi:tRNA (5-methylaminomethyl-2-thiouridine)(34)-methyltransferase MnmD [Flavobacterium sp. JP2137]|uniref:tRNA (5-methylaminomethyl-2-thiouridine)(34)-methyltransferase MnmD n=1 Tax=Flavobacterium sp. JP2137 TaxID=3414510 RepID=UPI003D2FB2F7